MGRINYDSGAAATALPMDMAKDLDCNKVGEFIVASGEAIPNYGRVRLQTEDEWHNPRKMSGSITEVHKPLGSAGEISGSHDAYIWGNGGVLAPKNGPIAIGMKKEYNRLARLYGEQETLPLYKEGNLFNFYLRLTGEVQQLSAADPQPSPSGNRWQGPQHP